MKNLFQIIACLFSLSLLSACHKSEPVQPASPNQPQQQTPSQQNHISPVPTVSCDEFVKKIPDLKLVSEAQDGSVQMTTDSNRVVDEATFSKWLGDFAGQIFSSTCVYKKISISATLAEGYYLEAVVMRSDHDLFRQGKISEAEWQRRFEVKRVETLAYLFQALKGAREKKEHTQALSFIDRILEKEPQNQTVLLIKANVLLDQNLAADAALLYQSILATQPDQVAALFNLGVAQKDLGSFTDSLTTFEKLLNLPPPVNANVPPMATKDQILLQLVDAALKNNDLERTGRYLEQLQAATSWEAQVLKAQFMRMQGKYVEAKDVLQGLANQTTTPACVLFDLTLAYLDLKDAPNAKLTFEKLKSADPVLAKELEFLQPFHGADTPIVSNPNPSQSMPQQAPEVVDEDTDYAEQPVETGDEGEGQKF